MTEREEKHIAPPARMGRTDRDFFTNILLLPEQAWESSYKKVATKKTIGRRDFESGAKTTLDAEFII